RRWPAYRMTTTEHSTSILTRRANELLHEHEQNIFRRADYFFARLMIVQWLAAIAAALVVSPRTWIGDASQVHPHVWAAILFGGTITGFPVLLALTRPGEAFTRHTIGFSQMLMSALLIHLTGGRIETHFHVFGSLAFLAFYRDWRVLVTATVVVAADHFLRGVYWPQSVFGVLFASNWRWVEHAGWVVFEDVFLTMSILQSRNEMRGIAFHRAELEESNAIVESRVKKRTSQLTAAHEELAASEERFRTLSNFSPIGIFQTDAAGKCVYANPRWEQVTGFTCEQSLGEGWMAALHPADAPVVVPTWQQTAAEAGKFDMEFRFQNPSGEVRWVRARTMPIRSQGTVTGHVGTISDITNQKRGEAERQVISDIVQGVITTTNLNQLLDLAWRSIGKLLYAENCFVALHDEGTDLLDFVFWIDKFDVKPPPQPVGKGLSRSAYVLRTGRPLLLTEELKAELHARGELRLVGSDSPSWLGVPLRTRERTIGVL